ncbi:MAG: TIGR01459 family HAD-type hydrolase [Rhodobacteraceae bacterium]|nr:TIGR01459 family HAD-type hydrolase [Paracoccaceae bacterium]
MTRIIASFNEIALDYDVLFFDVWGCLHDGVKPYPKAIDGLFEYKKRGGTVVLLTNSPRPGHMTTKQINSIGVPRESWDIIVTSGDAAQHSLFSGDVGNNVYHIGTINEYPFFHEGKSDTPSPKINRVPLQDAEGIVCTGPFDENLDNASDYLPDLEIALSKGMKLLCANPDLEVHRGAKKVICAGAIARQYEMIGGDVLLFGKPKAEIYNLAYARAKKLLGRLEKSRILCVGDGPLTDLAGAIRNGYPSLFVTGGLAREETGTNEQPEPNKLHRFLAWIDMKPDFAIGYFG